METVTRDPWLDMTTVAHGYFHRQDFHLLDKRARLAALPQIADALLDHWVTNSRFNSPVMAARRFPPPWTVEERPACYIVKDANDFDVAFVYYEEEPGRRAAAKLMTQDEARRIALGITKLPDTRGDLQYADSDARFVKDAPALP